MNIRPGVWRGVFLSGLSAGEEVSLVPPLSGSAGSSETELVDGDGRETAK